MEPKLFCLHRAGEANNHVKQGGAFILARHPINVAYDPRSAMLTILVHIFS
jgi:hypothetical protein